MEMFKDIDFKKIGFNVSNIGFFKVSKLGKIYRVNPLERGKLEEVTRDGGIRSRPYFLYFDTKVLIYEVLMTHYLELKNHYKNYKVIFKDGNEKNTRLDNIVCINKFEN